LSSIVRLTTFMLENRSESRWTVRRHSTASLCLATFKHLFRHRFVVGVAVSRVVLLQLLFGTDFPSFWRPALALGCHSRCVSFILRPNQCSMSFSFSWLLAACAYAGARPDPGPFRHPLAIFESFSKSFFPAGADLNATPARRPPSRLR
jgi:hypothetical protein